MLPLVVDGIESMVFRTPYLIALLSTGFTLLAPGQARAIDLAQHPGKAIYAKLCLECHGPTGEGSDKSDADPLFGDSSLASLTGRIERTMPEDNEAACVGPDAAAVAEYIYHAFYSVEAQARLKPVQRDLTHLTAPQLQNSLADMFALVRDSRFPPVLEKHGLKGEYFANGNFEVKKENNGSDRFERIDPRISFDYGTGHPEVPEDKIFTGEGYGVRWSGSIFIEESGPYEFTLRTRNGAILVLNDHDDDLGTIIDAWVASDDEMREQSATRYLLGGRSYTLQLKYFKFKQPRGGVELLWKKPGGVREVIPERVLGPDWSHPVFVTTATFPPDDRSYGYERGTSLSREWLDAVHHAAFEAGDYAAANARQLARTKKDDPEHDTKLRQLATRLAEAAFRRPLHEEEKSGYVDRFFDEKVNGATDSEAALRKSVAHIASAPLFLYPDLCFDDPTGPWARASSLSLALWDSLPNKQLREAAGKDKLNTPEELEKRAWDMLWDGRARHKMRGFSHHWLETERGRELNKDAKLFPDFDQAVLADLGQSLDLFVDEIIWSDASDYRQLMLADYVYLNERLAPLYGHKELKGDFQKVVLADQQRSGVITHPYLLSSFSYRNNSSPIHRGVFLTRNIAGLPLKPPPEAILFADSHFPANLTMREKVTELTRSKACMSCHSIINPLGFSLEHYDAIGRWRNSEQNKPINDDSVLQTDSGERFEFSGPHEVARFAAESTIGQDAFVRQLFQHTVKQPHLAYGLDALPSLQKQFRDTGCNIRNLLVKIAVTAASPPQPPSS